MPHKHTRRPTGTSDKNFDLPPTVKARPLSVGKATSTETKPKKRKRANADDTPREFKRLMQMQASLLSKSQPSAPTTSIPKQEGRSNRRRKPEKGSKAPEPEHKRIKTEDDESEDAPAAAKDVVQAKRPSGNTDPSWNQRGPLEKDLPMLKEKSSRLQRKIEKKVSTWRSEDERLRKKREDDLARYREEEEERIAGLLEKSGVSAAVMEDPEVMKQLGLGDEEEVVQVKEPTRGKKKRRGREEDDWEILKGKREAPKGLHDVVKAPPELRKVKDRFKKQKDGAMEQDGGLKRKADLGEARLEVIRRYRELMGRKGGL
ncbi:Acyl-CoA dehydrogenase [Sphaceloma murrayae]|uniref:Acyl-CoA dehydrogenase n=1 Tax=Sphaceloma murrayae TaxID=2082308 RepID=A0A2K1QWC9_9PEZI|nr:Acyl-CoA dehydrogenase [Sphaceloma murrayae]